jgi:predicted ATPase
MKLKSIEIADLLGRQGLFRANFNDDINILTGRNGSGKTSALKLLWYVLSGNILLALREIEFSRISVHTTEYTCTVYRLTRSTCKVEWSDSGGEKLLVDQVDEDGDVYVNAEDEANSRLRSIGSSLFLPTFRRIEGGFSIGERTGFSSPLGNAGKDIEQSLSSLSKRLSNGEHTFVASLSTVDIVNLLVAKYANLSENANQIQQEVTRDIIRAIKAHEETNTIAQKQDLTDANKILDSILRQIEKMEKDRESAMKPFSVFNSLVSTLFKHSGIRIGRTLNFGDAASAVNSDLLSAGEKQMLSFIAYNGLYRNSIIIIDEPELSLHVDWQRQLFAILLRQESSNQFIVATHSPFIYSKYPDKEMQLDVERGDELGGNA